MSKRARARGVTFLGSCSKYSFRKAAASEDRRRYRPHFVGPFARTNGSWRTEKLPPVLPTSENLDRYVEDLSDARTTLAGVFNSFLFVVLVFRIKYLLPLLLFHRIMQEHSDKHRIERAFFQRSARRNRNLAFFNHAIHPDLLIRRDQDRNLDQPHTSHHIHRSLRES